MRAAINKIRINKWQQKSFSSCDENHVWLKIITIELSIHTEGISKRPQARVFKIGC